MGCCSDSTVSFHYVSPKWMYVLDFLIYHVKTFGISGPRTAATPAPPPDFDLKATPWTGPEDES